MQLIWFALFRSLHVTQIHLIKYANEIEQTFPSRVIRIDHGTQLAQISDPKINRNRNRNRFNHKFMKV